MKLIINDNTTYKYTYFTSTPLKDMRVYYKGEDVTNKEFTPEKKFLFWIDDITFKVISLDNQLYESQPQRLFVGTKKEAELSIYFRKWLRYVFKLWSTPGFYISILICLILTLVFNVDSFVFIIVFPFIIKNSLGVYNKIFKASGLDNICFIMYSSLGDPASNAVPRMDSNIRSDEYKEKAIKYTARQQKKIEEILKQDS